MGETITLALALAPLARCTMSRTEPPVTQVGQVTYAFGPFDVPGATEVTNDCVQITMANDDYVFVNAVELTTGPGFHHSNWFFVPERTFAGEDGTYTCKDR